ncbi:MAG: ribbon-helix-helix protein, CopG family [Gallionella sp.]|nr:ribbon-helix-helix protein, CopG family [Gallionella sp.]MDD4958592.1 ribbon-helix-helix protein, CopG family [Gallionella sp.]
MGTLTLRLPEQLDARLSLFAKLEDSSRSELVRMALEKFLREREREQLLAEVVQAARFLATDPEARAESTAIADEFASADSAALTQLEQNAPEKWWQ